MGTIRGDPLQGMPQETREFVCRSPPLLLLFTEYRSHTRLARTRSTHHYSTARPASLIPATLLPRTILFHLNFDVSFSQPEHEPEFEPYLRTINSYARLLFSFFRAEWRCPPLWCLVVDGGGG